MGRWYQERFRLYQYRGVEDDDPWRLRSLYFRVKSQSVWLGKYHTGENGRVRERACEGIRRGRSRGEVCVPQPNTTHSGRRIVKRRKEQSQVE